MEKDNHSDEQIRKILSLKNVAVVGISRNKEKAAREVPEYLSRKGYNIIPINPTADEIMGKKCYHEILEVEEPIDIVQVFRPSEQVLSFIESAIKKHPKVIWLQEGIHNPKGEKLARKHGIEVVFNRCMLVEHERLF